MSLKSGNRKNLSQQKKKKGRRGRRKERGNRRKKEMKKRGEKGRPFTVPKPEPPFLDSHSQMFLETESCFGA